jgi:hypothetical protein
MAETAICPDLEAVEFHSESELKVTRRDLKAMGGLDYCPCRVARAQ